MANFIRTGRARLSLAAVAVLLAWQGGHAQSYSRGQNISPAFEGWEENADGSYSFLFGYMNRNWEEEMDVPVGADNTLAPGAADQGQPTHFLPRRNRFVFKVRVPADFGQKEMVWTLTTRGKAEKAYASLRTDYRVDDVVKASETGALGAGSSSPEVRANKPPVVAIEGTKARTVRVNQPLALVALVTDDGVPRRRGGGGRGGGGGGSGVGTDAGRPRNEAPVVPTPGTAGRGSENAGGAGRGGSTNPAYNPPGRSTVGKVVGLHLSWFVYRGSGRVSFEPPQVKIWEDTRTGANSPWAPLWSPEPMPPDGKVAAQATFAQPGTYVLHALADDGALTGEDVLTVTVTP